MFTRSNNQFRNYKSKFYEFFDQLEQVFVVLFVSLLVFFCIKNIPIGYRKIQNSWVAKLVVGFGEQDKNNPMLNKILV